MGKSNENNQTEQVKQVKPDEIKILKWRNAPRMTEIVASAVAFLACAIAAGIAISIATGAIGIAALPAFLGFIRLFANAPTIISLVLVGLFFVAHTVSSCQQLYKNEELKVGIADAKTLAEGAEGHAKTAGQHAKAAEKSKADTESAQAATVALAKKAAEEVVQGEANKLLGAADAVVKQKAEQAVQKAVNGKVVTQDDLANAIKELVKANDLEDKVKNLQVLKDIITLVDAHKTTLHGKAASGGTAASTGLAQNLKDLKDALDVINTSVTNKNTVGGIANLLDTLKAAVGDAKNGLTKEVKENKDAFEAFRDTGAPALIKVVDNKVTALETSVNNPAEPGVARNIQNLEARLDQEFVPKATFEEDLKTELAKPEVHKVLNKKLEAME